MGISSSEFSRKQNLSTAWVSQLKSSGKLVIDPTDGKIDYEKSVAALATRKRKRGTDIIPDSQLAENGGDDSGNPLEFQARAIVDSKSMLTHAAAVTKKENYLAALRELEYDIEAKKVVLVETVLKAVSTEYAAVRAAVLALPSKVAPRVIMMNSAEEARDFIEKEVRECLSALMADERSEI